MSSGAAAAREAAVAAVLARDEPDLLAVFVSGSVARGMATERSDVDVHLVLTAEAAARRTTVHGDTADEIIETLEELERPGALGTDAWWYRWTYAWVDVLRDRTGGRLAAALAAQASLVGDEQRAVLVDRLDGYVNFCFRALKADADGRPLERRLDAAESVPWLLDTVFALAGRVRPYNKYVAWELRAHPLTGVLGDAGDRAGARADWSADALLPLLSRMLDGDPGALRAGFAAVEAEARRWDRRVGGTVLGDTLDAWGDRQLGLLRGTGAAG